MLYKYINESTVVQEVKEDRLRFVIKDNNLTSYYLSDEEMMKNGFKKLVVAEEVSPLEFYHVETKYINGEVITELNVMVKDSEPDLDELIHQQIRERYSENDEFKMARTGKDTDELVAYNKYVQLVDAGVREYIERWKEA